MENNRLRGEIPVELGLVSNFRSLLLAGNQLTGAIPEQQAALANLRELSLGGSNSLTGCIPQGLRGVPTSDLTALGLGYCTVPEPEPQPEEEETVDTAPEPTEEEIIDTVVTEGESEQSAHSDDLQALRALYNSAGGPNWNKSTNWLNESMPLDSWFGVATDSTTGGVTSLILIDNDLGNTAGLGRAGQSTHTGGLPPEIGNMTSLVVLSLRDNQLKGELPHQLSTLTSLRSLSLSGNQFRGRIPFQWGGFIGLTSLISLNLTDNSLSGGIPAQLGNLTNLSYLYLRGNGLTGIIPESVGDLDKLQVLDLGEMALLVLFLPN